MTGRPWQSVDIAVVGLGSALVVFFAGAAAVLAIDGSAPTAFWAAGSAVAGGLLGLLAHPPGATPSRSEVAIGLARDVANAAAVRAAEAEAVNHPDQRAVAAAALKEVRNRGVLLLESAQDSVAAGATIVTAAQAAAAQVAESHGAAAEVAGRDLQQATAARDEAPRGRDSAEAAAAQAAFDAAAARSAVLVAAAGAADRARSDAEGTAVTAAASTPSSPTPRHAGGVLLSMFVLLLALSVVLASGAIGVSHGFGTGPMDNLTKTVVSLTSAAGSALIGLYAPAPSKAGPSSAATGG